MKLTALAVAIGCAGCAHPFVKIQPGMTVAEVRAVTVDRGPSDVRTWPQTPNAQAWYYGPDRCILVVDGIVTQKAVTRTRAAGYVPGLMSVSVRDPAQCAPMGVEQPAQPTTNIYVPGLGGGTIR